VIAVGQFVEEMRVGRERHRWRVPGPARTGTRSVAAVIEIQDVWVTVIGQLSSTMPPYRV
jgi:hypothetical protein